jgi:hypothetical protein
LKDGINKVTEHQLIVWNEPIIDEYWNEFEAEIDRIWQLEDIVTNFCGIDIVNVEITKERLAALVDIVFSSGRATNSSTMIKFSNANICGEGIVWLSKLVEVSSQLQTFCLHHNRIDNMDLARTLSRSFKSHSRIAQIYLTSCDF